MDRKLLVVANWKANSLDPEKWVQDFFASGNPISGEVEVAIAPPYVRLHELVYVAKVANVSIVSCAQDISQFSEGAYTGEVTAKMLADIGVKYCLVGHSERRKYFMETTEIVGEKVQQAVENDIVPIICAQTFEEIPTNISRFSAEKYLIMFEPSASISKDGQYNPESPEKINEVIGMWKQKLADGTKFLYGGSVNSESSKLYIENCKLLSGFVVGHGSLDPGEFKGIIEQCHSPKISS